MHSLVLEEINRNGGLAAIADRAARRAASIYAVIDASNGFYTTSVPQASRSRMTIPFRIVASKQQQAAAASSSPSSSSLSPALELEREFHEEGAKRGLLQLHGHPAFGGLRVTIYNGVPDESIEVLLVYMQEFARKHSK